jgi:hypothetical protein
MRARPCLGFGEELERMTALTEEEPDGGELQQVPRHVARVRAPVAHQCLASSHQETLEVARSMPTGDGHVPHRDVAPRAISRKVGQSPTAGGLGLGPVAGLEGDEMADGEKLSRDRRIGLIHQGLAKGFDLARLAKIEAHEIPDGLRVAEQPLVGVRLGQRGGRQ